MATVASNTTGAAVTETAGNAVVKIPKNTLVVVTANTDAEYDQRFELNSGGGTYKFIGQGRKGKPMKQDPSGQEYLDFQPAKGDRDFIFTFQYKPAGETEWKSPKVRRNADSTLNGTPGISGVQVINIGTEDAYDDSYTDTNVTICLFRKNL